MVARIQSTRYERYILTLIIYINIHAKVIIKTNIRHVFTSEVAQCPAECRNVKEEPPCDSCMVTHVIRRKYVIKIKVVKINLLLLCVYLIKNLIMN